MAKVKHHKNNGVTIHLNEDEKEGLRALLGTMNIADNLLEDLWNKILIGCKGKYTVLDVRTQQPVIVALFNKKLRNRNEI